MPSISNINGPNTNATSPIKEGLSESKKISHYKTKHPLPIQSPHAIKIKAKVEYTPAAYLLSIPSHSVKKVTPDQTNSNSSQKTQKPVPDNSSSNNQPAPIIANIVQPQDKPLIYTKPKPKPKLKPTLKPKQKLKPNTQLQLNRPKSTPTINVRHSLFIPQQPPTLKKIMRNNPLYAMSKPTFSIQQASIKKTVNLSANKKIINNVYYPISTPTLKQFKIAIYDIASGENSKPRPPDDLITHQQKPTVSANLKDVNIPTKNQDENTANMLPTPTIVFPPEPPIVYPQHPLRTIAQALKATIQEQQNKNIINKIKLATKQRTNNKNSLYIQPKPSAAVQVFADALKNAINQHIPKLNMSLEYLDKATAEHREAIALQGKTEEQSLKQLNNLAVKLEKQISAERLYHNQRIAESWINKQNSQHEARGYQQKQDVIEDHLSSHKQQKKVHAEKVAAAKTKAKRQANRHMSKKLATLHLADKKIKNDHIVDKSA